MSLIKVQGPQRVELTQNNCLLLMKVCATIKHCVYTYCVFYVTGYPALGKQPSQYVGLSLKSIWKLQLEKMQQPE